MPLHVIEKRDTPFTWADYRTWPDEERWEIIGGSAYAMSPAPSTKHQSVGARTYSRLERGLEGRYSRLLDRASDSQPCHDGRAKGAP